MEMAKRGYKLQEFVAHSGSVNCISIGKKTCRLFVSGGDDHKVNLWSIGEPNSLMSLCGHTSPIESVTFNAAEVLVVAGSSAGVIKLWDLEETKMVRTLTGHRSYSTAVEFHPFGEFFASGSMDTNLKIWDIRKKGCIHTYKGHTRGISTIRFSPDGRWVVSGGLDNVVKVWDLTAGKLLHDFKFHEGHIRSMDFHPLEFLLATGSADRTVKFWDLETFELIGSARPEAATGARSITFHPDGRRLFCGFDDSLKVYSWEPVICHDTVDMGWSTLGDLCIHDGKLLGCSYYQDSVGVWVSDISLIEPYRGGFLPEKSSHPEPIEPCRGGFLPEKSSHPELIHDIQESPLEKVGSHRRSSSSLHSMSADSESRERNNILLIESYRGGFLPEKSSHLEPIHDIQESPLEKVGSHRRSSSSLHSMSTDSESRERENISLIEPYRGGFLPEKSSHSEPIHDIQESPLEKVGSHRRSLSSLHSMSTDSESRVRENISLIEPYRGGFLPEKSSHPEPIHDIQESPLGNHGRSSSSLHSMSTDSESRERKIIPLSEPYRSGFLPEKSSHPEPIHDIQESPSEKVRSHRRSSSSLHSISTDSESREIKNIYVDSGTPVVSKKVGSLNSPKIVAPPTVPKEVKSLPTQKQDPKVGSLYSPKVVPPPTELKEVKNLQTRKQDPRVGLHSRSVGRPNKTSFVVPSVVPRENRGSNNSVNSRRESLTGTRVGTSFVVPSVVPRENPGGNDLANSRRESLTGTRVITGISQKPPHMRRPSATKFDMERPVMTVESESISSRRGSLDTAKDPNFLKRVVSDNDANDSSEEKQPNINSVAHKFEKLLPPTTLSSPENGNESLHSSKETSSIKVVNGVAVVEGRTRSLVERFEKREIVSVDEVQTPDNAPLMVTETAKTSLTPVVAKTSLTPVVCFPPMVPETAKTPLTPVVAKTSLTPISHPQIGERESTANSENDFEALLQNHDALLSTFRSRLTKLQVVRHFWERKDIKGAINAMKKLPDHSVQADVISILVEKMEILNLDLFCLLLPVLLSLLDSKMERHTNVSLEMLLKLVAVFGQVVRSTVSAPPAVGVDLQAEQRRECCKQCFIELQKIQNILPALVRRGGSVARSALELNLVLQ